MSSSGELPFVPARAGLLASRRALYALLAITTALVVLHVAVALLRDLPIWDEAVYLDWGRRVWIDGVPLTLPQSPGYSLLLGTLSLVLGSVGALRVAEIGSTLAFGGAIGFVAFLRWRTPTAGVLAAALALGSAHSFFPVGVHRTAIAILLLGAVALAVDGRKRLGPGTFLLCAVGAYTVRPEVVWAAPILPLAIWGLAPSSRPSSKALRRFYVGGLAGLAVLASVLAARGGANRNWLAFLQHYAVYRQPRLGEALGPTFSPWFDFDKLVAIDFPGASSPLGALRAAPTLVLGFMLANVKAAAILAIESMAASPQALPLVLAIAGAVVVLTVSSRKRAESVGKGMGWFMLAMIATSALAIEVVSNSRHVMGLSIALAFLFGLFASQRLAGRRFVGLIPVILAGASLWISYADCSKLLRYAKVCGYPVSKMVAEIQAASGSRSLKIAGQCNSCLCAYARSSCTEVGPPQGHATESQCALFEAEADFVSLRIDDGAEAAPACGADGYEMLTRSPAIGMELWGRRSAE
jgi:hypothetical protein